MGVWDCGAVLFFGLPAAGGRCSGSTIHGRFFAATRPVFRWAYPGKAISRQMIFSRSPVCPVAVVRDRSFPGRRFVFDSPHQIFFLIWGLTGKNCGFLVQSTAQAAIFFACVKIFFDIIFLLLRRRLPFVFFTSKLPAAE